MSDFTTPRSNTSDVEQSIERGVAGTFTNQGDAGRVMSVRLTDWEDVELPVFNLGYSFTLPPNTNAEVLTFALGNDVNDKVAVPQLPRDKQYQWPEGTGGIQHPTDPDRRVEFNKDETHHTDGVHVFGPNKEIKITVSGGSVTLEVAGTLDIKSTKLTHNGVNIGSTHVHGGVEPGSGNTGNPK